MTSAPSLLFQAHSRRGLGHLARGLNIANEVRALAADAEITFHVSNDGAANCCPSSYRCIIERGASQAISWAAACGQVQPDVSVFDTVLHPEDVAAATSRRVFVLRKTHGTRHDDLLSSAALEEMDLVIVPHGEGEFDSPLPAHIRKRTVFVGPIVRLPTDSAKEAMRRKYSIAPGDFVLTSTAGGGGFTETASRVFQAARAAHALLLPVFPTLRHIVVLGPQCALPLDPLPGMTVVQSEPELINLFALSSLVVAESGYNTVNELRVVKTPAVFIPGARTYDNQEERARALEALGLARVSTGSPEEIARQIAKVAMSGDTLGQMHRCYAVDRVDTGNRVAAERILELVA